MESSKGFFRGSYVSMFPFKDGGAGMFIQNQLRVVGLWIGFIILVIQVVTFLGWWKRALLRGCWWPPIRG